MLDLKARAKSTKLRAKLANQENWGYHVQRKNALSLQT